MRLRSACLSQLSLPTSWTLRWPSCAVMALFRGSGQTQRHRWSCHSCSELLQIILSGKFCSFPFLHPSQVTVQYRQDRGAMLPVRVHTIVVSVQHDEDICLEEMRDALKEKVVKAVVPCIYLDDDTIYHLQPSGRFVIGGPQVNVRGSVFQKVLILCWLHA